MGILSVLKMDLGIVHMGWVPKGVKITSFEGG